MIPTEKSDIAQYVPASLSNVAAAPAFLFRPATKRDAQAFERLCNEEGVRLHGDDVLRSAYRQALQALYSPQEAEDAGVILNEYWTKRDQGIEIADSEILAALTLLDVLERNHKPLRVINADNYDFFRTAPMLAASLFLVGWKNLNLEFKREAGIVPLDVLLELGPALEKVETAALADKVAGVAVGAAFLQLQTHALDLLNLTRAETGKSPSLSPSSSIQNGSETDGSPAATSQAPSTKPTPRRKSAAPTAT